MFKKKKVKNNYIINVYPGTGILFDWQYDIHLDGKLIKHGWHDTVKKAQYEAEAYCLEHAKSGKYAYSV